MFLRHLNQVLLLLILISVPYNFLSQTTDKLAKEANALFKAENFIEATPKYLQLLSLEPRSAFYNYRYGACLLFNSEKKPEALKYLKFSVTDAEVDPEAHYYLARAYHVNYYFDRAIRSYQIYKGLVKDKTALKRDVDRQIEMCRNGQRLMSKVSDLIVKERKSSAYDEFFRIYNLRDIGGSILVTEDFQSKIDKKRGHKPIIHLVEDRPIIFYSSYGETDEDQKDIYFRVKNEKGDWSEPSKLPNSVNTAFDEDYPYLDPNGKYLYFSSKGHNSMGGYDVFRISINLEEMKFGSVENLDFAISSPDDDLFYVVDSEYKHAYFASARQSEGGKIHVYRVMVNKFESNALLLAGDFISEANPKAKNITVQVKEISTGKIIDQVQSNPTTGALSFSLPRGGQYEFIVKTENTKSPQVIAYEAPFFEDSRLLKLNFVEESTAAGASVRVSQDDYYQFQEEERADALANLFLSKAELLPNLALQDLLEQSAEVEKPVASKEVLKKLKLDKYPVSELASFAARDLNLLKENFRQNEDQKKIFLQLAADQIAKAQSVEEKMNRLFDKSESTGLTELEIKELKRLDRDRSQLLAQAVAANQVAQKLNKNATVIQADIAKADAIHQKMKLLKSEEDLAVLEQLNDLEKIFVKEQFNQIKALDADQLLESSALAQRLQYIESTLGESGQIEQQIAENEFKLTETQNKLESAKKKEKVDLEQQIQEIETTLEGLKRQERYFNRQNEKLLLERDSLQMLQKIYAEGQTINPNTVVAANNSRLIEAKLKAENSKKVSQKTESTIENTKVIEALASSEVNSANPSDPALMNTQKQAFQKTIQDVADQIFTLDKALEKNNGRDLKERLNLQNQKKQLIQQQIETLEKMAALDPADANVKREIEEQQTQLAVSENAVAEIEDLLATASQTTPNTSNSSESSNESNNASTQEIAQRKQQYEQEIRRSVDQIQATERALQNAPREDYNQRLNLENQKKQLIQQQIETFEKMAALDPADAKVKREREAQQTQLAVSENAIAEIEDLLATASQTTANTSNSSESSNESNNASTQEIAQRKQQYEQEIQQTAAQIQATERALQSAPREDYNQRLNFENQKKQLIQQQIETFEKMAALDPADANVKREREAQQTQLAVSENAIAEIEKQLLAANPSTNSPDSESNAVSKVDREVNALKKSYNLSGDVSLVEKNDSENLMRVQRYEAALENMLEDDVWSASEKASIQNELAKVSNWLDAAAVEKPTSSTVASNEKANTSLAANTDRIIRENASVTVAANNDFARERADEILSKKLENEDLFFALESAESSREEKRIVKRIEKNEKEIFQNQYALLLSERDDYEQVTKDMEASMEGALKKDPLIKSEYLILQHKLDDVQEVIDVLSVSSRADRERILVQANNKRDDFLKQMNLLQAQIKSQQEINRVVAETGIEENILSDSRKFDYALSNINEEIELAIQEIDFLKRNFNSYAKSEQPAIENDITLLEAHIEDLKVLKKETQRKVQERKSVVNATSEIPRLQNATTNDDVLLNLTDNELVKLLNEPSFLALRNNLVSFSMFEVRLQNARNNQKSTRNEMQALINKISTEQNESIQNEMREKLMILAQQYKTKEQDILAMESEMQRLKNAIDSDETYQKNPVFYNTIASSPKIQDLILALSSSAKENADAASISPIQLGGITMVNAGNRPNTAPNFNLNPVEIPGLVYKVQIGAFNRPIDISRFAEFEPVTTDQLGNSIRYSAGIFYNKNQAFTSLNPIKAMGYRDAFVVAYCDGVRYSVAEADELLRQGKCSLNNAAAMAFESNAQKKDVEYNKAPNAAPALALESTRGVLFTVQIGVFNTPRTRSLLQDLEPLNTQLTERNQIRYSVGRFDDIQAAVRQREQVKTLGFTDAFIVAYYNGELVSVNEARNIIQTQGDVALYNRQQIKPVELADLNAASFVQDSSEQLELLNAHELAYRLVSKTSFSKTPGELIEKMRAQNLWVYYDEQLKKVISSTIEPSENLTVDAFEVQPMYQGFVVKDTAQITYQNLEGYQAESSYYTLTLSWDRELPALVAFVLQQNMNFATAEWKPTEKQITFAPLNYIDKERIRKSLMPFGGVWFSEEVVTF